MAFNPPIVDNEIPSAAKWNTAVGVYHTDPAIVDAVSSTSLFSIYEPTIGAGHMSTARWVRITMGGTILQNATAALTLAVRSSTGTLWQTTLNLANDADRADWTMVIEYLNRNSASVQRLQGRLWISDRVPAAVGRGSDVGTVYPIGGADTFNTAGANTVGLVATWSVNSANASFQKLAAITELL